MTHHGKGPRDLEQAWKEEKPPDANDDKKKYTPSACYSKASVIISVIVVLLVFVGINYMVKRRQRRRGLTSKKLYLDRVPTDNMYLD